MTNVKKKRGRPVSLKKLAVDGLGVDNTHGVAYAPTEPPLFVPQQKEEEMKVGTFITVNTVNVKGLRINLDKVFSYAPNGETSIQVAQGDGNSTTLSFGSKEDMLATLELLDNRCQ